MTERLDLLEQDHRDLSVKVDGISRGLEGVQRDHSNLVRGLCRSHRKDTDDLEGEVEDMKKSINLIERRQDSKWPSLVASVIGGAMMLIPFIVLVFTMLLPALRTLESIAGVPNGH